ncbi:MAG: site-specific DNA-methyltransferase [Planctomycetes bacterium]|nr:site-specific DNA-methyltransferase [Planctomycetota bacterium]
MKLVHGDCREYLFTCELDSIDLTVTSPPYDNLRTYNNSSTWGWAEFSAIAAGLWRVTKPGGVVVWVVGDATIKGSETGTSFKQALYFKEVGFNLHDTMIYKQKGTGAKGSCYSYWQGFEYMFVLSKERPKTVNRIADKIGKYAGKKSWGKGKTEDRGNRSLSRHTNSMISIRDNVWEYVVGFQNSTTDRIAFDHPAIFPEKLAHDHIISWSNEGDTVFDPFMGSGTTGKMAKQLNRDFIGIEIDKEYFEIAKQRIEGTQYNQPINRTQKDAPVI